MAMIKGTQADTIIEVLRKIPERLRNKVEAVTLDMAASMNLAVERCFRKAHRVTDRFHVQRLACDAVQELRIKYRWEVLDLENEQIKVARAAGYVYQPEVLENGDTLKQLLARSRYLLFKHKDKWTASQKNQGCQRQSPFQFLIKKIFLFIYLLIDCYCWFGYLSPLFVPQSL